MRDIDKYTRDYNQSNFEDYQLCYRRRKIIEFMDKYKPQSILEIGCGMQPLFQFLNHEFKNYVIVEPSNVFFENAKQLSRDDKRIICYNNYFGIDNIDLSDCYNMIVCSSLLHEVENPDRLVKSLKDVSNPNTIIHINVPNANSFHRLLAKEMGLIEDEHEMSGRNVLYQQHNVFDRQLLKELLIGEGFEILDEGSYFIKPFTHGQMYEMMKKGIIDEKVLDGLYAMVKYMSDLGSEIYVNCRYNRNIEN